MKFNNLVVSLALGLGGASAFHVPSVTTSTTPARAAATTLFAKSRKARRQAKKASKGRSQQFYEAIEEAAKDKDEKKDAVATLPREEAAASASPPDNEEKDKREQMLEEAQQRYEQRPDVSTMIVDEETGNEVLQQGQNVLDVVTRKAVKLSDLGPEYRMAQMFPGVPMDVRDKYRVDWNTIEVPQLVDKLRDACSVKLDDGTTGIPKHPNVANSGIDFVLANRDLLGFKMKRTLIRLQMRAMWQQDKDMAIELQKLTKNYITIDNHISAPFRQILQDAEGRMGPNFGNLDLMKFSNGDLYERIGNYLVLKGMVAHWEKKVVDAKYIEETPQSKENFVSVLARGDPKRYLPDPPILFTLKECTQVCAMAQQMCNAFVENKELFADFPPEIIFLEEAFKISGGKALRKYIIDEFCPQQGITPEALREGMRRFYLQLDSMQTDPYGDLTNKIEDLAAAMAVGTEDQRDPYVKYLVNTDEDGPGYFQTYTFDHAKLSLVRFLDNQYPSAKGVQLLETAEEEEKEDGGIVSSFYVYLVIREWDSYSCILRVEQCDCVGRLVLSSKHCCSLLYFSCPSQSISLAWEISSEAVTIQTDHLGRCYALNPSLMPTNRTRSPRREPVVDHTN